MFRRLCVQILAPDIRWTFFIYIFCKNCNDVCSKRPKINNKRGRVGPFKKTILLSLKVFCNNRSSLLGKEFFKHYGLSNVKRKRLPGAAMVCTNHPAAQVRIPALDLHFFQFILLKLGMYG